MIDSDMYNKAVTDLALQAFKLAQCHTGPFTFAQFIEQWTEGLVQDISSEVEVIIGDHYPYFHNQALRREDEFNRIETDYKAAQLRFKNACANELAAEQVVISLDDTHPLHREK